MNAQSYTSPEDHKEYLRQFQINPKRAMFTIILSILVDVFGHKIK